MCCVLFPPGPKGHNNSGTDTPNTLRHASQAAVLDAGGLMMSSRTVCFVAGLLLSGSALGEFKPDPGAMVKELEIASTSDDRVTLA